MAIVFSWDNYVDDATLMNSTVAGSELIDKGKVKGRQPSDVFRHDFPAASPLGGTLLLDFDLGSSKAIDLIAILNHDMAGLSYTLKFSDVSAGGTDIGSEGPNVFFTGTVHDPANEMLFLATALTARYVQLSVTVPTTRTVDIGRVRATLAAS